MTLSAVALNWMSLQNKIILNLSMINFVIFSPEINEEIYNFSYPNECFLR